MVMKTMPAGQFKAQCLSVMDEVKERRAEVIITKRGKPVAKLVPLDATPSRHLRLHAGYRHDPWGYRRVRGRIDGLGAGVKYLLDTHVLIWLVLEPKRLTKRASSAVRRASRRGGFGLAAISLWEVAVLCGRGIIKPHGTASAWTTQLLAETGIGIVNITPTIAELATEFPAEFPRDPADRLIAATARAEGVSLITADERIRESPLVETLW